MLQLSFARRQTAGDFSQALGVSQLAEHHRDELRPTGKAPSVAFGLMPAHRRLELQTRDHTQNLTENAAYSVHGGISVRCIGSGQPNPTYRGFHLPVWRPQPLTPGESNLIWTRVILCADGSVQFSCSELA